MALLGYGVIEGFYGPPWALADRLDCLDFLAAQGFSTYVYAPKADRWLRDLWRMAWPAAAQQPLREMASACRKLGLRWGIGFSPLGADLRGDGAALARRIDALRALAPDLLCVLFDDVRGDMPGLARRQCQIVERLMDSGVAEHYVMCPTYYSNDPALARLFGAPPADYFAVLGERLPASVGVFWTGERVVSKAYQCAELEALAARLGRRPVLWDNYPVNDFCPHRLHLAPFSGRPAELLERCDGHLANPMPQCRLSWLALHSLASTYRGASPPPEQRWREALGALCSPPLQALLLRDADAFRDPGRKGIAPRRRRALRAEYAALAEPMADEVVQWLAADDVRAPPTA